MKKTSQLNRRAFFGCCWLVRFYWQLVEAGAALPKRAVAVVGLGCAPMIFSQWYLEPRGLTAQPVRLVISPGPTPSPM